MSSRHFNVERKMKTWEYVKRFRLLHDAMNYIASRKSHKYPYRIVRVVKTVVFQDES